MNKFRLVVLLVIAGLGLAASADAQSAPPRKHTVKASSRPYKKLGHAVKVVAKAAVVTAPAGFFTMFDAAVVDPFGVALQTFADGVDLYIAQPLQSAPPPFRQLGDGLYYVYAGVDKVGQVLAK